MKQLRRLGIAVIGILLISAFQNCGSSANFSAENLSAASASTSQDANATPAPNPPVSPATTSTTLPPKTSSGPPTSTTTTTTTTTSTSTTKPPTTTSTTMSPPPTTTTTTLPPGQSSTARRLFSSGFENGISLGAPDSCGPVQCLQNISGQDSSGSSWSPSFWGSSGYLQLLSDKPVTPSTISQYMTNEIQTVVGHKGTSTRALYQELRGNYGGTTAQQDPYIIAPTNSVAEQGDLYIRMWVQFQPDLATKQLVPGQTPDGGWGNWRVLWEWKSGGQGMNWQGDYRFIVGITMDSNHHLSWSASADNVANSNLPKQVFYENKPANVAVPVGQWFLFETFTHRSSGSDGRLWAAVDGHVIGDFRGPNMGVYNLPINRIMLFQNYTGGYYPSYQWIDDIEIWNGFPADASAH